MIWSMKEGPRKNRGGVIDIRAIKSYYESLRF